MRKKPALLLALLFCVVFESAHAENCPDGNPAMFECDNGQSDCDIYILSCIPQPNGLKYCCDDTPPPPKPTVDRCPDNNPAFNKCTSQEDCETYHLTCEAAASGQKYCCAKDDDPPPPPPSNMKCPDGERAFVKCKYPEDCSKVYHLECVPRDDGFSYCCGTEPDSTDAPPETKDRCKADNMPAFIKCPSPDDCNGYHLICEETSPGNKHCCAPPETTIAPPPATDAPPESKDRCKADNMPAFIGCTLPTDCNDYHLVCEETSPGKKHCCAPPTDDKCPDGFPAMTKCTANEECTGFKLECREVAPGKKYCCGGGKKPDPPKPTRSPPRKPEEDTEAPDPPAPGDDCQDKLKTECPVKSHLCDRIEYDRLSFHYCRRTCEHCPGQKWYGKRKPYPNRARGALRRRPLRG